MSRRNGGIAFAGLGTAQSLGQAQGAAFGLADAVDATGHLEIAGAAFAEPAGANTARARVAFVYAGIVSLATTVGNVVRTTYSDPVLLPAVVPPQQAIVSALVAIPAASRPIVAASGAYFIAAATPLITLRLDLDILGVAPLTGTLNAWTASVQWFQL